MGNDLFSFCSTSTETVRIIRNGEPRTSTSTFTQLLSSGNGLFTSVSLYVHRDDKDYSVGTGSPGRPPRLSHSTVQCCLTSTETMRTIFNVATESIRTVRDGEPRTSTSTFTQLRSMLPYIHRDDKDY